jgi:integrase
MALVRKLDLATPDLFTEPGPHAPAFRQAFDGWVAEATQQRLLRASSRAVYADMWGAFTQWCLGQQPPVQLDRVTSDDLERFVASRRGAAADGELSRRHAWRVLRLIDRVLAHRAATRELARNDAAQRVIAASEALRRANLEAAALPDHLDAEDARQLVVHLSALRAGRPAAQRWQDLRNATAVALQLGAGLTPGDVRALAADAAVVEGGRRQGLPWKLRVPGNGNRPPRETPIAQWAGELLRRWLEVRTQTGFQSPWLFPGTRRGGPWGKVTQYDAVKGVLEDAGLPAAGGSFRLRHTFALRQLRRGKALAELAAWMGIVDPAELERYRRVLAAPVDVV